MIAEAAISLHKEVLLSLALLLLLIVESPPEEHDVRLRSVDCIVHPSSALLHSDGTPLIFREKAILRKQFGHFRRKNYMPVLVSVIEVLLRVLDLTHLPQSLVSNPRFRWDFGESGINFSDGSFRERERENDVSKNSFVLE